MQQRWITAGVGLLGFAFTWWLEVYGYSILKTPSAYYLAWVISAWVISVGYIIYGLLSGLYGFWLLAETKVKIWAPSYALAFVATILIYQIAHNGFLSPWWSPILMIIKACCLAGAAFLVLSSIWEKRFEESDEEEDDYDGMEDVE